MSSVTIHTFLVHPGRHLELPTPLTGKELSPTGKLFDLLTNIFHTTPDKRDFEITFLPTKDGVQQNDCRDLILSYQATPTLDCAKTLATRLQLATDNRSGMGLLFIMTGQHGTRYRTVLSRFPANEAILAEVNENGLDVEFLEQVFIRRMAAYKAVLLEDENPQTTYWSGFATDRQAGGSPENISDYWMTNFLAADFSETAKAGTRRLAEALKKAVRENPVLSVKAEIASAVSLAPTALKGKSISIDEFCTHFGLSDDAISTIKAQLSKPSLSSKKFNFDSSEFKIKVPYRTVEMESGAILTAPSDKFNKVFEVEEEDNGVYKYTTSGRVSDQRMSGR